MNSRKEYIPHLTISVLSLIGLFLYINFFDPKKTIIFSSIKLDPIFPFFGLIFLGIAGVSIFALSHLRRGILIGILAVCFFLFSYLRVNNILYSLIVVVIIILIELFFLKKK